MTTTNTISFNNVKELHKDMTTYNQSFTMFEQEINTNNPKATTIERFTVYRLVELAENSLHFYGNKFGGSEMIVTGNLLRAEKVDNDNDTPEYRLYIDGRNEPLVFLACKKREYMKRK